MILSATMSTYWSSDPNSLTLDLCLYVSEYLFTASSASLRFYFLTEEAKLEACYRYLLWMYYLRLLSDILFPTCLHTE